MPNPYESMHAIKDATAKMTEHIDHLKTDGLVSAEVAKVHTLMAEQIGSSMCLSAILTLAQRETDKSADCEKTRFSLEKALTEKKVELK